MAFLKNINTTTDEIIESELKAGDVVYLINDFDGNWPMTVVEVGSKQANVFWFAAGGRGQTEMFPLALLEKAEIY